MGEYVVLELAKVLIFALVGSLATYIVMTVRRDVAEAAREDERVKREFGSLLARWRPAMRAARNLRPTWLPAAGRSVRSRLRRAVAGVVARLRPATTPALPVAAPPPYPGRDVNTFTWPTNPARPAPVGRASAGPDFTLLDRDLDFTEQIRLENARLHQQAQRRLADPDATGLIPAVRG